MLLLLLLQSRKKEGKKSSYPRRSLRLRGSVLIAAPAMRNELTGRGGATRLTRFPHVRTSKRKWRRSNCSPDAPIHVKRVGKTFHHQGFIPFLIVQHIFKLLSSTSHRYHLDLSIQSQLYNNAENVIRLLESVIRLTGAHKHIYMLTKRRMCLIYKSPDLERGKKT